MCLKGSTGCHGLTHCYFKLTLSMKCNCAANVKQKEHFGSDTSFSWVLHVIICAGSHFVDLVWSPWHQGGGPLHSGPKERNTVWPGQGSTWKNEMSKDQAINTVMSPTLSCKALLCFCVNSNVWSTGTEFFIWPDYAVLFTGNSICEQQCAPVDGQPQCSCSPGFSLRHDGHSCEGKVLKPCDNSEKKRVFLHHSLIACGNFVQRQKWTMGAQISAVFLVFFSRQRNLVPAEETFLARQSATDLSSFTHQRL